MLRILVIIAVALAVVIGLMQLAKHNNAPQAPSEALSEGAAAEPFASDERGVVDAAGAVIETPPEPDAAPIAAPDTAIETPTPTKGATPNDDSQQRAQGDALVKSERTTARPRRAKLEASKAETAPIDPYELQRNLEQPVAAPAEAPNTSDATILPATEPASAPPPEPQVETLPAPPPGASETTSN